MHIHPFDMAETERVERSSPEGTHGFQNRLACQCQTLPLILAVEEIVEISSPKGTSVFETERLANANSTVAESWLLENQSRRITSRSKRVHNLSG